MKTFNTNQLTKFKINEQLKRTSIDFEEVFDSVKIILNEVKTEGINAALRYSKIFDGFVPSNIFVTEEEFSIAEKELTDEDKQAIETAESNIRKFHELQYPRNYEIETMPGIKCLREFRPTDSAGLYIPGGTAVLPSTMLMLGIPARIAGVKHLTAFTPVKSERVNSHVLYAAKTAGITSIVKIGGAQAVALMAYGAEGILKVNKIFGPGNKYVTAAKMLVSIDPDGCAIDMPAGPSELLIIADKSAIPEFVAADLLSQAEHDVSSQVVLLSDSEFLIKSVIDALETQLTKISRKDIAKEVLNNSVSILCKDINEAVEISNEYAPEHLIINTENADLLKDKINNAGSVFLGNYSPESIGDYASGTNHSLPTYGYAKSMGGVTVESFMKSITFQKASKSGLTNIGDTVIRLAEIELLDAHANAVKLREQYENR